MALSHISDFFMATPKLTPAKYRSITKKMNLSDKLHARAHAVLVEGKSIQSVARKDGVSEEAVRKLIRRIVGSLRPTLPKLSRVAFKETVDQLKISPENKARAMRVLCRGETVSEVARDTGCTPGVLSRTVWRILDHAVPLGWRRVEVTVPEDIAVKIEAMECKAKDNYLKEKDQQ